MKLTIGSLDNPAIDVVAHYNPKEIDLAKQASWSDPKTLKQRKGDLIDLEYTGAPARSMSLELLFDGYESDTSIEPIVDRLNELASPRDPDSKDEEWARPHVCVVVWNEREIPKFKCVIESVNVKYTMFNRTGRPLRAVCNVKLKEVKARSRR